MGNIILTSILLTISLTLYTLLVNSYLLVKTFHFMFVVSMQLVAQVFQVSVHWGATWPGRRLAKRSTIKVRNGKFHSVSGSPDVGGGWDLLLGRDEARCH